ncbi:PTS sugar transporter subunit IIA [Cytobacillus massiliigabonensis]|uniref:PTS sugar transporter subunit IIA n=1 Tax=Cytobacillus massiliigabonensis TaxID=1871011 RepID=UPI000C8514AC|nr:PTS glucose transporter subunit IIA [Cytobacillus massiliigabonensis]
MLSKLFKKRRLQVFAPLEGEVFSLDQVPDPVFSKKMMGEGAAILPKKGGVHAPFEGTIILVAETKHAIGIRADDGTEVLIHVGLETVSLKGEGFQVLVKNGDLVSAGQLLMEVNWRAVGEKAKSLITPIVITNSGEREIQVNHINESKIGETVLMTVWSK